MRRERTENGQSCRPPAPQWRACGPGRRLLQCPRGIVRQGRQQGSHALLLTRMEPGCPNMPGHADSIHADGSRRAKLHGFRRISAGKPRLSSETAAFPREGTLGKPVPQGPLAGEGAQTGSGIWFAGRTPCWYNTQAVFVVSPSEPAPP